uniref:tumor necrosis factor-like n=1 Tax=Scatophagus argus TaxID=75038 RepID=UPI001ED809E0|nr:tumor necrosis factor-like [Scatophagus argus]
MAEYMLAPGDGETDRKGRVEVLRERKSSTGWVCRVSGALLCVALCVGAIRLFAWYWSGRPEVTTQAEHHNQTETEAAENITDYSPPLQHHESNSRLSFSSRDKAAIHLVPITSQLDEKLEWTADLSQAFSQGGLILENNTIVILQTGAYFVYSQAAFTPSCSSGPSRLSYRILCLSLSYSRVIVLMDTVKSVCTAEDGLDSSYLGAVFHLQKGDRLFVETNYFMWLVTHSTKTFFGAFKV